MASTPEFLGFTIVDRESWEKAKARMSPARDRINWKYLEENYTKWRESGLWIQAGLWFGFDVTHSWIVGTERLLYALVEDPDWCRDMFKHELETQLSLLDMVRSTAGATNPLPVTKGETIMRIAARPHTSLAAPPRNRYSRRMHKRPDISGRQRS